MNINRWIRFCCASVLLVVALMSVTPAYAEGDGEDLAKKTQNPISDLISVPFQNNWNFNVGPRDKTQYVLNIQPVIPVKLSGKRTRASSASARMGTRSLK